jgi:hypothetical protein
MKCSRLEILPKSEQKFGVTLSIKMLDLLLGACHSLAGTFQKMAPAALQEKWPLAESLTVYQAAVSAQILPSSTVRAGQVLFERRRKIELLQELDGGDLSFFTDLYQQLHEEGLWDDLFQQRLEQTPSLKECLP